MKKILIFCFCVFAFLGCGSDPIEEAMIECHDLFIKGDVKKSAECFHFKNDHGKERYFRDFYSKLEYEQDKIKEHGGIKSKEVIIINKGADGKSAKIQLVIKYKDGKIETQSGIEMINVDSKWLIVI